MKMRLERAYKRAERITIDKSSRIVCMSDCHRGVGNRGDNFLPNQHLFLAALRYYDCGNFCYMELGDGDELWENRNLDNIKETHKEVFDLLYRFHCQNKMRMLYGNHDISKKNRYREVLPGLCAQESILLIDRVSGREILLIHGHQGDLLNDILVHLAGFLVRFVWRPLELVGVTDPTSTARNYNKRKKTEKRLETFSRSKQIILIAGHTHRPMFPEPGEGYYFNDGSCVHPEGITALEIEQGKLTLVKWGMTVGAGGSLCVTRIPLAGPVSLELF